MGGAAVIINSEAEWTAALEKATAEGKAVRSVERFLMGERWKTSIDCFFSSSFSLPRLRTLERRSVLCASSDVAFDGFCYQRPKEGVAKTPEREGAVVTFLAASAQHHQSTS